MEDLDTQILSLLARDGRMSYTDIGKATGLSTSAAQQRVRRLEQRGVITGYRAIIDPAALGKLLTAFISVTTSDPLEDTDLPPRLAELPEVTACYSVAGRASYVVIAQVETPADLERVLTEIRVRGHANTETQLVLSVPFADRPLV
ncbi:Lrp/AsnC family transcriptional regulator [Propioniciclava sinopodophylli]|uniref:Lrp/AsnC family transcriptional regulator n=1 Tax=Propioniciclava sinopodophylli TaxID=1837344 RepID=A0A4Q9KEA1_9ACTN|nr:Lrp/AsnC family transcriptional regulator [Propioniciclava sinopodophylli]TBT85401.1 Lrp/AsnC family transcriptional regulator [Propioniciclava sinopodophylli]